MALKPAVAPLQSTADEVQPAIEFQCCKHDDLLVTVSEDAQKMKEIKAESKETGNYSVHSYSRQREKISICPGEDTVTGWRENSKKWPEMAPI